MTDADIADLREAMLSQRREIRDDLAEAGVDVSSWTVPEDGESDESETAESG